MSIQCTIHTNKKVNSSRSMKNYIETTYKDDKSNNDNDGGVYTHTRILTCSFKKSKIHPRITI